MGVAEMPYTQVPVYTGTVDANRRDFDCASEILEFNPDETPFLQILLRAKKRPTTTTRYDWYDEGEWASWTRINNAAGYGVADVTFAVDDSTIFVPNDILQVARTGESMRVLSIDAVLNTVTVEARSWGTVAAAAIVDDDWLVNLGPAQAENSTAPTPKLMQPNYLFNYTQIFRTTFDASASQEVESLKTTPKERIRLRQRKGVEHKKAMERSFIMGERVLGADATTGAPIRSTGGLNEFITTNRILQGGVVMTESAWEDICEQAFNNGGSRSKLLIACPSLITQINSFAAGKLDTTSGEETYGLRLKKYISAHGDLIIVRSDTFRNGWADRAFIVDPSVLYVRPLSGRDTKLRANIQANDRDGWEDEWLTEAGFMCRNEHWHTAISGIAL
jgi:hypothetical protein